MSRLCQITEPVREVSEEWKITNIQIRPHDHDVLGRIPLAVQTQLLKLENSVYEL